MYTLNSRICPQKKYVNLSATKLFFLAIFSIAFVSVGLSLSAQAQATQNDSQTSSPVSRSQDMNAVTSTYTQPVVITLNHTNLDLIKSTQAWLTANVSPETESQYVTWSTSNANVVFVDSSGKLTAMNEGTAEITATSLHGVFAKTFVTVRYAPVTAIYLNVPKNDLLIGETTTLSAVITPQLANPRVNWVSNNPYVASVDETGKVTAHHAGQALIIAVTTDNYVTAQVYMNVNQVIKPVIAFYQPYNYKLTVTKITSNRPVSNGSYLGAFPMIGYHSSDPSVVTINQNGECIALKPGIVTITVYAIDGYTEYTTITVTD